MWEGWVRCFGVGSGLADWVGYDFDPDSDIDFDGVCEER